MSRPSVMQSSRYYGPLLLVCLYLHAWSALPIPEEDAREMIAKLVTQQQLEQNVRDKEQAARLSQTSTFSFLGPSAPTPPSPTYDPKWWEPLKKKCLRKTIG